MFRKVLWPIIAFSLCLSVSGQTKTAVTSKDEPAEKHNMAEKETLKLFYKVSQS